MKSLWFVIIAKRRSDAHDKCKQNDAGLHAGNSTRRMNFLFEKLHVSVQPGTDKKLKSAYKSISISQ